jgi:hypothetical protein
VLAAILVAIYFLPPAAGIESISIETASLGVYSAAECKTKAESLAAGDSHQPVHQGRPVLRVRYKCMVVGEAERDGLKRLLGN